MKKLIPTFVILAAFSLAVTACGKKAGKDGDKKKAATITLAPVSDAKFAYEIMIPKGSKTLQKGAYSHTYSYPLPDGMYEYNVNLIPSASAGLPQLVNLATMVGGKQVAEKKAHEGGFLVVKKPRGALQQIWFSRKGKTKGVTAKCSGPAKAKALLLKICTSLKVTK